MQLHCASLNSNLTMKLLRNGYALLYADELRCQDSQLDLV